MAMLTSGPGNVSRLTRWLADNQKSVVAVVALFAVILPGWILPSWDWRIGFDLLNFPLPAAFDSRPSRLVLLFFLAAFALIAFALGLKLLESRAVARWSPAPGRIIRSREGYRTIHRLKGMPEDRKIADIAYEYTLTDASGKPQTFTGERIGVAEQIAAEEVAGLLARYPVGATVTIHHDTEDPTRAVLELEAGEGRKTIVGLAWLFVVFAVIALPVMWFVTNGEALLRTHVPNKWALGAGLLALGAFILFAVFARLWRNDRATANWPSVEGLIVASRIEAFDGGIRRRRGLGQTVIIPSWTPTIDYAFTVAGREYVSRNLRRGTRVGGNKRWAQAIIERYPAGAKVRVLYDPANPEDCGLETGLGLAWSIPIVGLLLAIGSLLALTKAF
jgi:hypothetical protein